MRASSCLLPLFLVAATAVTAPATAAEVTDQWEQTYPVRGRPTVDVLTNDGNVVVQTWDRHAVKIRVSTVGWRIGPNDVEVHGQQAGDRVHVEARTPRWDFTFTPRLLRVDIWAPREADFELKTGDGDVEVPDVHGRLGVRTGDGSITVTGARGDLRLWTGDGRINGRGLAGSLDAHTGDGNVIVDGRFEGLVLRSGDGTIVADLLPGTALASGATASTGDGRLTLRVPSDFKADLEAYTGDGSIDVDLPMSVSGRISRTRVRGTLNGGGPPVRLRSGDGSIKIEVR